MKPTNATKWAVGAACVVLVSITASGQYRPAVPPGFVRLDADEIQVGNIYGDPNKPGMYVVRNRFMPGQGSQPGSFVFHPAYGHHYDGAKDEEVIVQIMGMGPVTTTNLESGRGRGTAGGQGK